MTQRSRDRDHAGAGEVLGAVVGNVLAVPVVLGFVALGAGILVGRSVVDVVGQAWKTPPRDGRHRRRSREPGRGATVPGDLRRS